MNKMLKRRCQTLIHFLEFLECRKSCAKCQRWTWKMSVFLYFKNYFNKYAFSSWQISNTNLKFYWQVIEIMTWVFVLKHRLNIFQWRFYLFKVFISSCVQCVSKYCLKSIDCQSAIIIQFRHRKDWIIFTANFCNSNLAT